MFLKINSEGNRHSLLMVLIALSVSSSYGENSRRTYNESIRHFSPPDVVPAEWLVNRHKPTKRDELAISLKAIESLTIYANKKVREAHETKDGPTRRRYHERALNALYQAEIAYGKLKSKSAEVYLNHLDDHAEFLASYLSLLNDSGQKSGELVNKLSSELQTIKKQIETHKSAPVRSYSNGYTNRNQPP